MDVNQKVTLQPRWEHPSLNNLPPHANTGESNMSPKKGLLYFNRKYIFQPSFFRGYVSFQGGMSALRFFKKEKNICHKCHSPRKYQKCHTCDGNHGHHTIVVLIRKGDSRKAHGTLWRKEVTKVTPQHIKNQSCTAWALT